VTRKAWPVFGKEDGHTVPTVLVPIAFTIMSKWAEESQIAKRLKVENAVQDFREASRRK